MTKLIFLFNLFFACLFAETYEISHIKNFPYTGGPHTGGPDAIGALVIHDGYFFAPDHDPRGGYGGLWRIDECGNNPGFTDIDSDRDGPIYNVWVGKKYIYSSYYIYDKDGNKIANRRNNNPYEVDNYLLESGGIYDISNINNIKKHSNLPINGVIDIQGNSIYEDGTEGRGDLVYFQTNTKVYLYSYDYENKNFIYKDDINIFPGSKIFSDSGDNLYIYSAGKISHYEVDKDNKYLKLKEQGIIPGAISARQFIITHVGSKVEAVLFDGMARWYDISDFKNIKFRTGRMISAIKIAVKNNLIFRAYHYGIDIYMMKGDEQTQDMYIQDNNKVWQKEPVKKNIDTTYDSVEFLVKIDNKDGDKNRDHEEIVPLLKAPASDDNFEIHYYIENDDITSEITSNEGYKKSVIEFGDSLILKIVVKSVKTGSYVKDIDISSLIIPKSRCGIPIGSENKSTVKAIVEKRQRYNFKVVDEGECFNWDAHIKTKIVDKKFNVTLLAKTDDTNEPSADLEISKLDLVDCNDENKVYESLWEGEAVTNKNGCKEISLKPVDKAIKCAKIKVTTSPKYDNDKSIITKTSLSDSFAIRPKEFKLTLPIFKTAGKAFTFQAEALNENGNPTKFYNEKESFNLEVKEQKSPPCITGKLNFSKDFIFSDGNFEDKKVKYDNIGIIDIKLSEKKGREFALIDKDDTPDVQRLIKPVTLSMSFIPAKFKIDSILSDFNKKNNITFYSNKPDLMGANLGIKISALSSDGSIVTNYADGCYANDINLTLSTSINSNDNDKQSIISNKVLNSITKEKIAFLIVKSYFNSGIASEDIKINLSRNDKVAKNPTKFTVDIIKVDDGNISSQITLIDNNEAYFYYGRAHVSSPLEVVGKDMDAKVYYEIYCKDCDKDTFPLAKGRASVDSIN